MPLQKRKQQVKAAIEAKKQLCTENRVKNAKFNSITIILLYTCMQNKESVLILVDFETQASPDIATTETQATPDVRPRLH